MSTTSTAPAPLVVSASLAAVEGMVLAMLGVIELASWDSSRAVMNVTTTLFFLASAVALLACAFGVWRGSSVGRAPIIMFQLIGLGVAWSFRGEPTTFVAAVLAVAAVVTIVGLLHPDSIRHLSDEPA